MQCPSCGHENREGRNFCVECGSRFSTELRCANCGAASEREEKFCGECGESLPATSSQPSPTPPFSPAAEPTSFASGRYQVQKFLGEGGKKRVYLATATRSSSDCPVE